MTVLFFLFLNIMWSYSVTGLLLTLDFCCNFSQKAMIHCDYITFYGFDVTIVDSAFWFYDDKTEESDDRVGT